MKQNVLVLVAAAALALGAVSCSELKEELPSPVSAESRVHIDEWNIPAAPEFHGKVLKARQWDDKACTQCHAASFQGGSSGVSCFPCHDSYPHEAKFNPAAGYHPGYLQPKGYPLAQCKTCHGESYAGGPVVNVSCTNAGCHVDRTGAAKSPEACNTCHGDFRAPGSDLLSSAPPNSVAGDSLTTVRGVGAHKKHLVTNAFGKALKCQECHTVPPRYDSPGHLGALPADVAFNDTLAKLVTGNGTLKPSAAYSSSTLKCSNTYCHGNWRLRRATSPTQNQFVYTDSVMVGANFAPVWTGGAGEAACGTCHGLPPSGHQAYPSVSGCPCHGDVVDASYKITNKEKHINGKIDLEGNPGVPFR